MAHTLVGKAVPLQLQRHGFKAHCRQFAEVQAGSVRPWNIFSFGYFCHGGAAGTGPFTPTPPPPSLPGFGPDVLDHGRRRRPKEILLDLVEGEKLGFHPMRLYSKYSVFLGEPNSG